jgi:hypothetical protein
VKLPKIHLILCKSSLITKQSTLGLNTNSSVNAEEIENCWRFVYDIYTKHRHAFEIHSSNDQQSNHHLKNFLQAETFEEFMCQYVMKIGNESNTVSRIAVKSHSPLLPLKHPHPSPEYQSNAQTFDKTLNDIVERI